MVLVSDQKTGLHPPNLTMTNEPHLSAHSTRNYFLSHRPSRRLLLLSSSNAYVGRYG